MKKYKPKKGEKGEKIKIVRIGSYKLPQYFCERCQREFIMENGGQYCKCIVCGNSCKQNGTK